MILKIFSPGKLAKNGVFSPTTSTFCKNWIVTLVFEKNAI
jgi:hypothetical protein